MRVLAISGSLRGPSHNTRLLRAAEALLPQGTQFELFDGLRDVPPYEEELETAGPRPAAVRALDDAIARADAVLFSTPEYNGSMPGVLKNALDWVSRPRATTVIAGKPVAVVGASPGLFGAVWAQADLRKVLSTMGASVVDGELPVAQVDQAFAPDGTLVDADHVATLSRLLEDLVKSAEGDEALAA